MPARLSKSRIMSSLQCLKRVHLEVNRPELARYSAATEAAFRVGHEVGEIAVRLYGDDSSVMIEYSGGNFTGPLAETERLMRSLLPTTIFEATLSHQGVLVREDVLLPIGEQAWRVVEVKASTRLKAEHVHDCAIQAWVHRGAGHQLNGIALAHVDNRFVYQGNGDFDGLLVENDLTEEVNNLVPEVPRWVDRARQAAQGPIPDISVGSHCTSPYECPFIDYCWPRDTQYPVQGLGGNRETLADLIRAGYRDIREVPAHLIDSEQQLRIRRVTRQGTAERLPGASDFAGQLGYPRYYLDFETVATPVPIWAGTRPYQVIPFQWSCHIETAPGDIHHDEFLDLSGELPLRRFAQSLVEALGDSGPVLMYTAYERRIIRDLIEAVPEFAGPLQAIDERLVDLYPATKANYYHPDMMGSWSIKAVLPTIAPDLDYANLEGIHEGTEASRAFLEAIEPGVTPERRQQLESQLLAYCAHDTKAMVRLLHFLAQE